MTEITMTAERAVEAEKAIAITYDNDRPTVSGRDLHERLNIESNYTTWFKRMCEYGFEENRDYILVFQKRKTNNPKNPETEYTDHQLTLDMAKQICMIQRTDEGKRYREYFLEVERRWNDPQSVMARSLIYANRQLTTITEKLSEANARIEVMRPKAIFADAVSASESSILVGNLAKILTQNGVDMNQNRLFAWLRNNDYLMPVKGSRYNLPTQWAVRKGFFEIKEHTILNRDGTIKVTYTPLVTGEGQIPLINKFLGNGEKKK